MKLINSSYEILEQGKGLQGIYEQIERVGKTCYKSEVKGGESAKKFVEKMIANQHYAMLEHGTVYLAIPITTGHSGGSEINYMHNKYSVVTESEGLSMKDEYNDPCDCWCVTTNLRVLVENGWMDDLKYYLCEPTQWHVKRVCVRFICDRGVSHELVRHRVFSFAQESTRYCNYSQDRFGKDLTFIKPAWYDSAEPRIKLDFEACLDWCASTYLGLLEQQYTPQQARQVLPNALKTEICMTGFVDDAGWKHFFDLRALDKTGPAHPDMKALALPLYTDFIQRGLINPQ